MGRLKDAVISENSPADKHTTAASEPKCRMLHSGFIGSAESSEEQRNCRPWLLPHQTGDRIAGKKLAKAVNAKRTPIGGFAVFDLSKAPK
jgi:hypothetical protein